MVKNGKIDEAISLLPTIDIAHKDGEKEEEIVFSLLCLKVVNMIRD